MAFHQPTRQSLQRVVRPQADEPDTSRLQPGVPSDRTPDESQTWVLFAPTEVTTTTSYLSETDQSLDIDTPGRSRVGDLGSLGAARSEDDVESRQSAALSAVDNEDVEDDAELDSLDSHLPEFRSIPGIYSQSQNDLQQSQPLFPSHDGLGSFRLDQPALGVGAQDHIYQFEQFNPRRVRQGQETFDLAQLKLGQEEVQESEKRQRIEAWRLEHSRVLLSEIQRETRRRRLSQTSLHRRTTSNTASRSPRTEQDVESEMTWHDEDAVESQDEPEGLLARITRTVMRDVLGIDERMLSILLGDSIPEGDDDLSTTPRASQLGVQPPQPVAHQSWQLDILERVSRELGFLVNQFSHHPGAFSTYDRIQQMQMPYAGLPMIPETNASHFTSEKLAPAGTESSVFPQFQPTMKQATQPIDIPGRTTEPPAEAVQAPQPDVSMNNTFTKEEWERDLDVKLVFRYLRSRFLSRDSHTPSPTVTSHLATSCTQDTAARVARIRQHHPLISRMRQTERRTFKATTLSSPVTLRHPSSCASQSTRRSARRSSVSSRHYWDIGGSLGTGSIIASNGPMGSWGEV